MKQTTHSIPEHMTYLVYVLFASILVFIAFSIKESFYDKRQLSGVIMAADVAKLQKIFEDIHQSCRIISFDYKKNPINFLNVKAFTSSEVGPMNLADPKGWQGPYILDNPEMQGIAYQVIRTKQGHFIIPGDGVVLPDGKKLGSDLLIDENTDIAALTLDKKPLNYQGKALAAPLNL